MTEEDKKFLEEQFNAIQKRLDSIEKEMKALKKATKWTEAKLKSIQEDLDGKFELIEADIANAEASIMDTIDECTNSWTMNAV